MPFSTLGYKRTAIFLCTCLVLTLSQAPSAGAWGNEGHVFVNTAAVLHIPQEMPAFLRRSRETIAYLGPEPDRWRGETEYALKQAQEPDHFIDLERIAGLGELPPGRYEFYRLLYERRAAMSEDRDQMLPERVGLQPYVTMEIYGRLRAAFREYRKLRAARQSTRSAEQAIVFYAGWLGHYVGDAAQPMHTSIHFDGWVGPNPGGYTTERGIHYRFETAYVAQNIALKDFAGLVQPPARLVNPFRDYVTYLQRSHGLLDKVYQIDKAGGFEGVGSPEGREFAQQRLAAASQMLLNLWYTAWIESGEAQAAP
jgi:hypothetical protein